MSYLSARGIHLLEEVKSQRKAAAYVCLLCFSLGKKKEKFCLSARTLNHISAEYVECLRSSSYESTGRGSGKLQAAIRASGLHKFRACRKMLCFHGIRPKACKLWSTLLLWADQVKPEHPFLGDGLGMRINSNKPGKKQCFPTASEGCVCSFSYDNDNSSWCLSSISLTSDGGCMAEAQGNLCWPTHDLQLN